MKSEEDIFHEWLDNQVEGRVGSNPGLGSPVLAKAVSAAKELHGHVATPARAASNWEDLMMQHAAHTSRPLKRPRPTFHLRGAIFNQVAALAAVVVIVAGLGASIWKYSGGFGSSEEPTEQLAMAWQASPEATNFVVEFTEPKPEDCTVEPLTVEQTMEKLLNYREIDYAGNPANIPNLLDQETREELVVAQRKWLACKLFGSPFHVWALETGLLVRQDIQSFTWPVMNPEALRSDLEDLKEEWGDQVRTEPVDFGEAYLPMVANDSGYGGYDGEYPGGVADITISWVNASRNLLDALSDDTGGDLGVGLYWAYRELPNTFRFVYDNVSDRWLLAGFAQGKG